MYRHKYNNTIQEIRELTEEEIIQIDVASAKCMAKSTLLFLEQEIED